MNQRDLAIDEPTRQDLIGSGDGSEDGVDPMTLRMGPPAAFDGFADDGLGEARGGSLRRNEDDTLFPDEGQRLLGGGVLGGLRHGRHGATS